MIEIIGFKGSAEYSAAEQIKDAIISQWPDVEYSSEDEDNIKIAANTKISGYQVQDIDIVLCGKFSKPKQFKPLKVMKNIRGDKVSTKPIMITNFVVAIEVKEQSNDSVKFVNDQIYVKYTRGGIKWKDATDQNVKQLHSLNSYFEDQNTDLFLRRCLIFPSLSHIPAPSALVANFDVNQFFSAIGSISPLKMLGGHGLIESGTETNINRALSAPIFKMLIPTDIDRKRMDRLTGKNLVVDKILAEKDKKFSLISGYGGTGKTVALLKIANKSYQDKRSRTLFLTYNHALASDVKRLMSLMNMPTNSDDGGIAVETSMSFMYRWFSKLNLLEDENLNFEAYHKLCEEVLDMITGKAITHDDIEEIIKKNNDYFDFDQIFVDEGQDWPLNETLILKYVYQNKTIVVADGIDQLTRGGKVNWLEGIDKKDIGFYPLKKCLRMKRNLSIFAKEISDDADLGWDIETNDNAPGGKIIITKDDYKNHKNFHNQLVEELKTSKNEKVDMLFCVPPSNVLKVDETYSSQIGILLQSWNNDIWDGVNPNARMDFVRNANNLRVVQYASCRGLEGWTVILEAFDTFLELKYNERFERGLNEEEISSFQNIEDVSMKYAFRWGLIPLTRPINTLVINLLDKDSLFGKKIMNIAHQYEDFVEYI